MQITLLSDAWKLPQNDFVGPIGKEYTDSHQTKIHLNQRDNFLISDEVRKDIKHHLLDDSVITNERNYNRKNAPKPPDVNQQSLTEKYIFSAKGNEPSNSGGVPSIQKDIDLSNAPVLKLDIRTESPDNITTVTMPTIPVLGGKTMAVTVASNYGQIPIDDISVRIYENPIELRGRQHNKKIFDRLEQYDQSAENEHQNTFRKVHRNHQTYRVHNNLDPIPHARESDVGYRKIETFSEDATTTIGNLPTPLQVSELNSKKQTPIHKNNVSPSKNDNREIDQVDVRSRYRPRNTFRHKYFSRHTPDLRFKRDLSRMVARPGPRHTGRMTLNLHDVSLEDEAMYECQVKPLGGPAKWGRAKLNIQGKIEVSLVWWIKGETIRLS